MLERRNHKMHQHECHIKRLEHLRATFIQAEHQAGGANTGIDSLPESFVVQC